MNEHNKLLVIFSTSYVEVPDNVGCCIYYENYKDFVEPTVPWQCVVTGSNIYSNTMESFRAEVEKHLRNMGIRNKIPIFMKSEVVYQNISAIFAFMQRKPII